MNRRDFLKLGGLFSASAFVSAGPLKKLPKLPTEAVVNGKIYRRSGDSSIQVSKDQGRTWQLHMNFGPENSILEIYTGLDGRLYAQIGFREYSFQLVLAKNETAWLSQPV